MHNAGPGASGGPGNRRDAFHPGTARIVTRVRALAELIDAGDPAWAYAAELIAGSVVPIEVLAPDRAQCEACLHQLQVSTRSDLGSVALNTGGVLVDLGFRASGL